MFNLFKKKDTHKEETTNSNQLDNKSKASSTPETEKVDEVNIDKREIQAKVQQILRNQPIELTEKAEDKVDIPTYEIVRDTKEFEEDTKEFEEDTKEFEEDTKEFEEDTKEFEGDTKEFEEDTKEFEEDTKEFEGDTKEFEGDTKEFEGDTKEFEEDELRELAKSLKHKIETGEIKQVNHIELVNSYLKLTSRHMSEKQQIKLRVRLIKANNSAIIAMLAKALTMVNIDD